MSHRRHFMRTAGASLLGAGAISRLDAANLPEAPRTEAAALGQAAPAPVQGRPYRPVTTLNGWSAPARIKDGVREFHLVAEAVVRELAPGMSAHLWGYNGQSPGPTLEAVEGERVRIFVTNHLPEPTTIHWHGMEIPSGMDGVGGLNQVAIAPGKTFVYEFALGRAGTFMYHPHADEMLQMAMGMMGSFIVHPRDPRQYAVDRDYVFLMAAYDIDPGSHTPKVSTMLEHNLWTWNSRVFPGIDPLVARAGERVRIRCGNLTMTNHPIHLHGHHFEVTGTDGGWVPRSARWPEVSVDVAVGQMRAIEFVARAGDWALHCHKAHHTMNAMGHDLPTMLGVDQRDLVDRIRRLVPDYMSMGERGMGGMGGMNMPLPDNTLPMMSGHGPHGAIEMGGMFSILKVRERLAAGGQAPDLRGDWYRSPPGTVAREWTGPLPEPARAASTAAPGPHPSVHRPGVHDH